MTHGTYHDQKSPRELAQQKITVYRDVKPKSVVTDVINCRTCRHAGMSSCTLYAGQCSDGSRYLAAPVLRFWRDA